MAITAKVSTEKSDEDSRYELFTTATAKSAETGEDITILESIGIFSKADLEQQKTNAQNQLDEINANISAIEALEE